MPVADYGVLRGQITGSAPYQQGADHYQILVQADTAYRVAVDVYSRLAGQSLSYADNGDPVLDTNRLVMFYKDENFKHPITAEIMNCALGFTARNLLNPTLHLDYLRTKPALFPINAMQVVKPRTETSPPETLNGDINPWVQKAMNNADAEVFAFGSGWNDNIRGSKPDFYPYFDQNPALGVHDIHMNQGDTGSQQKNNGTGQDGALFIHFKNSDQWVAMFFKFQNQSINTDNSGNPLS